ncbi:MULTISPECIES: hypothetical protein [unclassified Bradyrhizobium]|uniref:hypothetical protein n=1 Tax=unclassified Bradyrhizobium TaxID=2631580 RepID=UPI0028E7B2D4|nr:MULTISPECIES: hypothetical protein [unclassified Bradyrhizobium]
MQLHDVQIHDIEIIEVSKAARLVDKFHGAAICPMLKAQALSEKQMIQNLIMARLGAATVDEAQAIYLCDRVIAACERAMP